jgi:hypothetical protein
MNAGFVPSSIRGLSSQTTKLPGSIYATYNRLLVDFTLKSVSAVGLVALGNSCFNGETVGLDGAIRMPPH